MNDTTILGGLLALSLVGAYLTWTDDGDGEARTTDVVALRATADQLQKVTWNDGDTTIVMTRPSDDLGTYVWFEHTEVPSTPAPDEDAAADPLVDGPDAAGDEAPEPTGEPEVTTFAGNEQAVELWDAFAPLYALRELTVADEGSLASYGLDEPKTTIDIDVNGKTVTLELGDEAYGTRDRYARLDGRLFLLDDQDIRPLQFARTRLIERKLFPLDEKAIDEVQVRRGTDARTIVQRNADDRTKAYWADATSPETSDVEAGTWLGKLFRMRVRTYTDDATGLTPVFTYAVTGDGSTYAVEVLSRTADDGSTDYVARSTHNRALVELTKSLAEEAVADLDALFDGVMPDEAPVEDEAPAEDDAPVEDDAAQE